MSSVVPDVLPWQRHFLDTVLTVLRQFSDSCTVTTKAIHLPRVIAGTGEEFDNNREFQ